MTILTMMKACVSVFVAFVVFGTVNTQLPDMPENITTTVPHGTEIRLTWDAVPNTPVGGNVIHYNVYWTASDGASGHQQADATTAYVKNLIHCENYTFHVCAVNMDGEGPNGTETETTSGAGFPPPQNLTQNWSNSTHVSLMWDPPNTKCSIDQYQVRVIKESGPPNNFDVTDTKATFEFPFDACECSDVKVVAMAAAVAATSDAADVNATLVHDPPQNATCTRDSGMCTISWDPPASSVTVFQYIIYGNSKNWSAEGNTSHTAIEFCQEENYTVVARCKYNASCECFESAAETVNYEGCLETETTSTTEQATTVLTTTTITTDTISSTTAATTSVTNDDTSDSTDGTTSSTTNITTDDSTSTEIDTTSTGSATDGTAGRRTIIHEFVWVFNLIVAAFAIKVTVRD